MKQKMDLFFERFAFKKTYHVKGIKKNDCENGANKK